MSTQLDVIPLEDGKWHTVNHTAAMATGKGTDKSLLVRTRFDGYGNAIVRYIVVDHDKETSFEKFNTAAERYNMTK